MPTMQMPTMAPMCYPCPTMCYPGFAPTMPAHLAPPPNVFQPLGSPGAAAPAQTFQQPIDATVVDLTAMDDSDVPVERTLKRARASKAGGSTTKGVVHVQRLVLPDDIGERLLDMHPDEQRRHELKEKYDEVLASGSKEQVKLGGVDLKKILAARVELPPATVVDGARHVENLENKLRTRLGPTDPRRARPNARYDGLGEAREAQIKFDKVMTEAYLSLTEDMPKKDAAELMLRWLDVPTGLWDKVKKKVIMEHNQFFIERSYRFTQLKDEHPDVSKASIQHVRASLNQLQREFLGNERISARKKEEVRGYSMLPHAGQMLEDQKRADALIVSNDWFGEPSWTAPGSLNIAKGEYFACDLKKAAVSYMHATGTYGAAVRGGAATPHFKYAGDASAFTGAGAGTGGLDQLLCILQYIGKDGRNPLTGSSIKTVQGIMNVMIVGQVLMAETKQTWDEVFKWLLDACAQIEADGGFVDPATGVFLHVRFTKGMDMSSYQKITGRGAVWKSTKL